MTTNDGNGPSFFARYIDNPAEKERLELEKIRIRKETSEKLHAGHDDLLAVPEYLDLGLLLWVGNLGVEKVDRVLLEWLAGPKQDCSLWRQPEAHEDDAAVLE